MPGKQLDGQQKTDLQWEKKMKERIYRKKHKNSKWKHVLKEADKTEKERKRGKEKIENTQGHEKKDGFDVYNTKARRMKQKHNNRARW